MDTALIRDLFFRLRHGFKGYPMEIAGEVFRLDESLRRFHVADEAPLQAVIKRVLSAGDWFVDVGANFGLHTLLAARLVGETGSVLAVEPVPANLALLRRHLRLNGMDDRCRVLPFALTHEGNGEIVMKVEPGLSFTATCSSAVEGTEISVPCRSLDDCLKEYHPQNPQLIKIDVEGAEHEVVKGGVRTLEVGVPLLIEVHPNDLRHFGSSPDALSRFLSGFGYVEERISASSSDAIMTYHSLFRVR